MFKRTFPKFPCLLALSAALWLTSMAGASAQVLVYKLFFETTGKTLNYEFYDVGYFVVEGPRGEGTFVLTVRSNGIRYFTTASGGELFYVQDGNERLAVLTAAGGTGGATATYQATGNVDGSRSIGGGFKMPFARDLDGYLVASADSGDPVTSDRRDSTDGFAGYSKMKVRIDEGLTRRFNGDELTLEEAEDELVQLLRNRGYQSEPAGTTPTNNNTTANAAGVVE